MYTFSEYVNFNKNCSTLYFVYFGQLWCTFQIRLGNWAPLGPLSRVIFYSSNKARSQERAIKTFWDFEAVLFVDI